MANVLPNGKQQYTNNDGTPLAGGKVYTYAAGTSTPKATYADSDGLVPNANPVILDARGEATIFWDGAYKVVLKDANDVPIWTTDGIFDYLVNLAKSTGASLVGWIQSGVGAILRTIQDKLREIQISVTDFGADPTGVNDSTAAINNAIAALISRGGGVLFFPRGIYKITSTITINTAYIALKGDGGGIDGNQPFNDTWDNIVARAATRVVWAGASNGTMLNMQPIDDGAHNALDGNGVIGMMWDGAEIAGRGWLFKTLRNGRYADSSVVRCKVANIDLGCTTNTVYGGNVSLSNNVFDNVCASNANLTTNCNSSIPWSLWGNALIGGVCQNEFRNCQGFHATYAVGNASWNVENTDDNSWYECKWNGSMILHAEDTGSHSVTAFTLSQNHFFYKTLGHIRVKEAVDTATKRPSYGHVVYGYSGNLIAAPTVDGRGDLTVFGTTIDFAQRSGLMTYGAQPAITNVYTNATQSIANASTTKVSWNGSQYDRLAGWSAGAPTDIVVPNNVKWAEVTLVVSWANNSTGQRYAGIYLAGSPVAETQVASSGLSQMTVSSGVIPVTPGQVIDARVLQASTAALNLSNVCRMTVKWH